MIKILIVDDSLLIRNILSEILSADPQIKVVGTASNGLEALRKAAELKPDVITMDIEMPVMDGIEATKKITEKYSIPILIITNPEVNKKREVPFYAIRAGAIEVWEKPDITTKGGFLKRAPQLIREVKIVSSIKVAKRHRRTIGNMEKPVFIDDIDYKNKIDLIAIGSSTGGPKVLLNVFKKLPNNFPIPILVVQHIGKEFIEGLVRWISLSTKLAVNIAKDGEMVKPGYIYFAPGGYHMKINSHGMIIISDEDPVNSCKPSIDVFFSSVSENYGRKALGIIFTGMGVDGAEGLLNIKKTGGRTIVQDEESSLVFGMPAKAIEYGAANQILPLEDIIAAIKNTGVK